MGGVEGLGIAAVLAIGIGFLASGPRLGVFAVCFALIGLAYAMLLPRCGGAGASWDAVWLTTASLPLWFFGLFVLRVMIRRSVTLHLLTRPSLEAGIVEMDAEIADRASELVRLRLAVLEGTRLSVTARGRIAGRLAGFLYAVFRSGR